VYSGRPLRRSFKQQQQIRRFRYDRTFWRPDANVPSGWRLAAVFATPAPFVRAMPAEILCGADVRDADWDPEKRFRSPRRRSCNSLAELNVFNHPILTAKMWSIHRGWAVHVVGDVCAAGQCSSAGLCSDD
jgi:hypothetical protein